MREQTVSYYGRFDEADDAARVTARQRAKERTGWVQGGGDLSGLRGYRAHHPQARISIVAGPNGTTHWLTRAEARVWAIAHRDMRSFGGYSTVSAIAAEAKVSPGWASRVLRLLEGWGWLRAVVKRGRSGGIRLFRAVLAKCFVHTYPDRTKHLDPERREYNEWRSRQAWAFQL